MEPITIIGGGIGGLTLGVALNQRGVEYEIYEAAEAYEPLGAGIILRTNAMIVYDALGLAEDIRSHGTDIAGARTYTSSGKVLQDSDFRDSLGPEIEQVGAGVPRAKLQGLLVDNNAEDAIHMDKECVGIEDRGKDVRVDFADGSDITRSVVVGADGSFSTIREELFPDREIRYTNQVGHRGIPAVDVDHQNKLQQAWGKGISAGVVPLNEDRAYWYAVLAAEPGNEYDPKAVKAELIDKIHGMPEPIPTAFEGTDPNDIISHDYFDIKPMDTWQHGRVVLMGDAAHSMTPFIGQGGCQAIEDAYSLGKFFANEDSTEAVFEKYQEERIDKANEILEMSRSIGEQATLESYPKRVIRNLVYKYYVTRQMPKQNQMIADVKL